MDHLLWLVVSTAVLLWAGWRLHCALSPEGRASHAEAIQLAELHRDASAGEPVYRQVLLTRDVWQAKIPAWLTPALVGALFVLVWLGSALALVGIGG